MVLNIYKKVGKKKNSPDFIEKTNGKTAEKR
jgi:hypothetical protein